LDDHHVDWLTQEENLILHAGKTLAERAALFTHRFPDKRIAVTSLRRLYLQHKIKRKAVRLEKLRPPHVNATIAEDINEILEDFRFVREHDIKLIWLDECNFTKKSFQTLEYSGKRTNIQVD
jgi:hypothetical protein